MRLPLAYKATLFSIVVPGSVTVIFPYLLLQSSAPLLPGETWRLLSASVGLLLGVAIYLRCAWDFAVRGQGTPAPLDPPRQLVIAGLYRHTRNPMYLGVLLVLLAECLLFIDIRLMIYAAAVGLMLQLLVVGYEEPRLATRFGQDYRDYCRQVPRWGWIGEGFQRDYQGTVIGE